MKNKKCLAKRNTEHIINQLLSKAQIVLTGFISFVAASDKIN